MNTKQKTECILCGSIIRLSNTNISRHQKTQKCKYKRQDYLNDSNNPDLVSSAITIYNELSRKKSLKIAIMYNVLSNNYVIKVIIVGH